MNADRMSEAIALSSPSGSMSNRARRAAMARFDALFAADQPVAMVASRGETLRAKAEGLRRHAAVLRDMASMHPRSYPKKAAEAIAEAERLESEAFATDRAEGRA